MRKKQQAAAEQQAMADRQAAQHAVRNLSITMHPKLLQLCSHPALHSDLLMCMCVHRL